MADLIDGKVYKPFIHGIYSKKAKDRENTNHFRYYTKKLRTLLTMFEYQNTPENFDPLFLEIILNTQGYAVVGKVDDEIIPMTGSVTGKLDVYGMGTELIGYTQNSKQFRGKRDIDGVICYNDFLHLPDLNLWYYADKLTEIDKSLDIAITNSRDILLPVCTDDKMKSAIENAIKSMREGKPVAIVSKNLLAEIINNERSMTTYPLNHPENVQYIQYLLKCYDDIESRFWLEYGHNTHNTEKMAQVSTAEITGSDSVSQVTPYEKLTERKNFVDKINNVFGLNMSVDYSKIWKNENEIYMKEGENNEKKNTIEEIN